MSQPVREMPAASPSVAAASGKSVFREYVEAFFVALALAVVLRTFLLQAY